MIRGIYFMGNKVVVAGGGASGLTAAIFAARRGADVTILEHNDIVGKKILITGNGKCNMTNMSSFEDKYYSSDEESLKKIYRTLERFNATDTRNFFMGLGLCTKEMRDGMVYPVTEQAYTVLDMLKGECKHLNIKIETNCEVKSIKNQEVKFIRYIKEPSPNGKKGYKVIESRESMKYDRLILAMGGKASVATGSDGSGYYFASTIGHNIIEPLPGLVQLRCEGDFYKDMAGVRAKVRLALYVDDKFTASEHGELQLTDYGISGIPVFQISRIVARALYEGKKCIVRINLVPFLSGFMNEINDINLQRFSYKTIEELFSGLVHKKIASVICKYNDLNPNAKVGDISSDKLLACIREMSDFEIKVLEPNSFDNAQICSGGVPLSEVDNDFKSLKDENIYIVGELLDCDGVCGGYNLQWAWATGALAGNSAGNFKEGIQN
jgi:hypothetical protein